MCIHMAWIHAHWTRTDIHMHLSKLSDSGGHRSLAGRSPWGHKESDTTPQLNNNTADLFCCTVEINTTIVKQLYSSKNQLQRIVNGQLFNQLVNHFFETSKKKKTSEGQGSESFRFLWSTWRLGSTQRVQGSLTDVIYPFPCTSLHLGVPELYPSIINQSSTK